MPPRQRLSADDWIGAASAALAEGGVAAVAVEPLAARLGATKGSFYWHFAGRDDLLARCLVHWERTETDEVIAHVDAQPDPTARLHVLLDTAMGGATARTGATIELALQPTADHPLVAPVLARVTRRRLEYLTGLFADLGFAPGEAAHRSLLAYTAYLGHAQLAHATPDLLPHLPGYPRTVVDTLTRR